MPGVKYEKSVRIIILWACVLHLCVCAHTCACVFMCVEERTVTVIVRNTDLIHSPSLTLHKTGSWHMGLSHQGLERLLLLTPHTHLQCHCFRRTFLEADLSPPSPYPAPHHLLPLFFTHLMTAVTCLLAPCLTSLHTVRLSKMGIVASLFSTM